MGRFRYSLAGLMGLVLFVAVAFAALRRADDLWDSTIFSLTLGLLVASVLLAIHRAEGRRAYWLGFALFGGAYLGASLIPPAEARLLTTRALVYLDSQLPGPASNNPSIAVTSVAFSPQGRTLYTSQGSTIRLWDVATGRPLTGPIGTSEDFLRIGHSLTALVLALLGAHLSRSLYASGRGRREGTSPTASPPTSPTDGA
jgi:WD40 repeat protein